ncbi:MAG: SMC-Scp complex subunit ScpB, partial [Clostridiales bacterium]|nr:SMC-Scp complex subunit ScpB [Clostridiales bacterium]
VALKRVAAAVEISEEQAALLLHNLSDRLDESGSALCVVRMEDEYQLCARTQFAGVIRRALEIKKNIPLSQAAMEVLAVIAYNQPVTKAFVEQVRSVDCSGVIGSLCSKGLIEEKGRLELPGRPLLYGTTDHFLRCFLMESLSDLPPLPHQGKDEESELNLADAASNLQAQQESRIQEVQE